MSFCDKIFFGNQLARKISRYISRPAAPTLRGEERRGEAHYVFPSGRIKARINVSYIGTSTYTRTDGHMALRIFPSIWFF